MASSEKLRTFLADDNSSTYSEGTSIPDSESPRTPHSPENQLHSIKPFDLPSHSPVFPPKFSEGYAQVPPTFREMTLRLTLTRPDLRSCEEEPYGLSNGLGPRQSSLPRSRPRLRPFRVDSPVLTPGNDDATKENMNQIFADIDRELSSSPEGVVKRFWNRVRRG
ncbi:hypothetical protein NUW58_g4676 [Xylaria curta]|uniref:Uncharacterized protein n=1 Tax=Xylaria curta TaxID=42375 RepID=A0ACC1P5B5_9PEZI|nr:hypothetical protein NUW58_g4676 [Xylaria curta]